MCNCDAPLKYHKIFVIDHHISRSAALPSASQWALGKYVAHGMPTLCRVLTVDKVGHSANTDLCRVPPGPHSAKTAHVPSTRTHRAPAVRLADGVKYLPSASTWHSAKGKRCRVRWPGSRHSFFCRVLEPRHSANLVKKNWAFNFFWSPLKFYNLIPSNIKYFY